MTIPRNVLRFEVLLYLSLLIDTLSAAFIARPSAEIDQAAAVSADTFVVIVFVFFLLSVLGSLNYGLTLALSVDLFSTGLAGAGLYFSFSDDAEKWFH